ncbi:MAG: cell division protein FtsX [Bacteroidetes bacterium]|nr:MAG: cell division protein FtsX [Bacteroidota bacterium]
MSYQEGKFAKKRKPSYVSSVISISLVLFMLGLLGLVILHANKLSEYVKENIVLTVIVKESAKEVGIIRLQKMLDASKYVKSTEFVSKEAAAEVLEKDLGEDFIGFLGFNPLLPSIDIHLQANYANSDSIAWIHNNIMEHKEVKELYYEQSLLDKINDNIKTISFMILCFCGLLFFIAAALINNAIRLALYSKRFIIKSMQLVGATQGFIQKPFIYQSVLHGFYGALLAIIFLIGTLYLAQQEIPDLKLIQDLQHFGLLFVFILAMGILISWWSTQIAVIKYLRMKLDDLY